MRKLRFACLAVIVIALAGQARAQSSLDELIAGARAAVTAQDFDTAQTLTGDGLAIESDNASLLNLRGSVSYFRGDMASAEVDFSRAAELAPDSVVFTTNKAYAIIQQGRVQDALAVMHAAIERFPMDASAWTTRGYFMSIEGDLNSALSDYTKAIEVGPEAADAYFYRAQAFEAKGLNEQAVQDYTSYIDRAVAYDVAFSNRALNRVRMGDLEGALVDYDKAVEINPSNAVTLINRGAVYDMLDRDDDAVADYEAAIMADASNEMGHKELFAIHWREGEMIAALAVADRAIELMPENAIGYNLKSSAYIARKASVEELDEAATLADQAVKLAPDEAQGYSNRCAAFTYLAVAQNLLRAMETFIADCSKAIEIDPDYFDAYEHMGVAYLALGNQEKADEANRKADEIRQRLE